MITWEQIPWKGCAPGNYTKGREGRSPRYITFHHAVGSMESVVGKAMNEAADFSAHFTVGARGPWQMVDTDNTAWCNGNWYSNLDSVSIEHERDWRFGYRNEECINQAAQLVALIRKTHPTIVGFQRHNQIVSTQCPGDLPVEEIWNKATAILNPPAPVPAPTPPSTTLQIVDVQNRIVVTAKDANLWDLNFNTWAEAKSVKVIPAGTEVEISAIAKHPLGGSYYMTEYSFSKGIKNGINVLDCVDKVVEPTPKPPAPVIPPVEPPITPPIEPPVTPPVDPNLPTEGEDAVSWLSRIFAWIKSVLSKFKFTK